MGLRKYVRSYTISICELRPSDHASCSTIMSLSHPRDPLHGITLETIIKELVERYGWAEMGRRIPIRCFLHDPSVKSSLTFLRKTPWARERVEGWYIAYHDK
jgi:uncharacterized protein (DUF2132 family)